MDDTNKPGIFKSAVSLVGDTLEMFSAKAHDALEKAKRGGLYEVQRISIVDNLEMAQPQEDYLERFSFLNYDTMSLTAKRDVIIASIIARRISQISKFCRPAKSKYDTGFSIVKADGTPPQSDKEAEIIQELTEWVSNVGYADRPPEQVMNFEEFIKREIYDIMVFDQISVEKIPTNDGSLHSLWPVDSSTVRRARKSAKPKTPDQLATPGTMNTSVDYDSEKIRTAAMEERHEDMDPGEIAYVQVVNGRIVTQYTREDLAFKLFSPINDVKLNGYSLSPIEKLINIVTSHMFAEAHNRLFFCVSPDSLVRTQQDGQMSIVEAFEKYGDQKTNIWTGNTFHEGRFLKTRELEECETHLKSGQIIKTSDEHWFWVIKEGEVKPRYINQRDMRIGDLLLVSPDGYECGDGCPRRVYATNLPEGHVLHREWDSTPAGEDLFEILGWLAGDGHIGGVDKVGREGPVQLFYHYKKELDIAARHLETLKKYGVNCELRHHRVSKDNAEKHGHETSPRLFIHDVAFKRWLLDLGFGRSPYKGVPTRLFGMPQSYRKAFLRGLFSADGTVHKNKHGYATPELAAKCELTRSGAASLLNSLGIACTVYKQGSGDSRAVSGLRIQDIEKFQGIGFIQDYKNEFKVRGGSSNADRYDLITKGLSIDIASKLQDKMPQTVDGKRNINRMHLNKILRGEHQLTRKLALDWCKQYGLKEYDDILGFRQVPVTKTINTGNVIQMYDVEIFDSIHRFTTDGVVTHNTQGFSTRGILVLQGNVPQQQLDAFRRQWYNQVSAAANSWRTPIVSGEDLAVQWVPLSMSNRDMEWQAWMEYLVKVICAVYLINPLEIGWATAPGGGTMGETGRRNEIMLEESKDVGLDPLLRFVEDFINHDILPFVNPKMAGIYKFQWVGLGQDDPNIETNRLIQQLSNYKSLNEVRMEAELPPLPPPIGDIICNPVLSPFYQAMLFPEESDSAKDTDKSKKTAKKKEKESKKTRK